MEAIEFLLLYNGHWSTLMSISVPMYSNYRKNIISNTFDCKIKITSTTATAWSWAPGCLLFWSSIQSVVTKTVSMHGHLGFTSMRNKWMYSVGCCTCTAVYWSLMLVNPKCLCLCMVLVLDTDLLGYRQGVGYTVVFKHFFGDSTMGEERGNFISLLSSPIPTNP